MKPDQHVEHRVHGGRGLVLLLVSLMLVAAVSFAVSRAHIHDQQDGPLDCQLCRVGHTPIADPTPPALRPPELLVIQVSSSPLDRLADAVDSTALLRGPPALG